MRGDYHENELSSCVHLFVEDEPNVKAHHTTTPPAVLLDLDLAWAP